MEQLPDVVVRTLVPFLETESKIALRLTCTTTAEWVTTKEFLQEFKIPILSDDDLLRWITKENLLSSQDNFRGWSNFSLQQELVQYNQSCLANFFATFHSHLEVLELSHAFGSAMSCELWKILSNLKNLRHLTIHKLDISNCNDDLLLSAVGPLDQDRIGHGLRNLHLKTFSIKQITFCRPADLRAWSGIFKLLAIKSANFITIPKPHYQGQQGNDNLGITWSQVKALQWAVITESMLTSMESSFAVVEGRKILLDVKHLVPIHFGRLAERVMTMNRNGFNLSFTHVHANHVKYVFLLSGDEGGEEFLGRILWINEKIDDRRPLSRWTGLERLIIRSSRCDVRNSYKYSGDDEQIIFPRLKRIEIEFDSVLKDDPGWLGLHRLISLLFKVKRRSVREVVLKWSQHLHDVPRDIVDVVEIRENFCQMQKLVVISDGVRARLV